MVTESVIPQTLDEVNSLVSRPMTRRKSTYASRHRSGYKTI